MPPKVVYGKKKSTTRTTTSFSKFISPKKVADVAEVDAGQNAVGVVKKDWRQQLEDAAGDVSKEDALAALAKGLGGLRLEQTQSVDEVKTKKKGRPRKAPCGPDAIETKENQKPQDDHSEEAIKAPAEEDHMKVLQPKEAPHTQKPKRRIALESCTTNIQPTKDVHMLEPRSNKKKTPRTAVTPDSSPTRRREPRSRTKLKTSSPRRKQLATPEPTPEPDDVYTAYVSPLLSLSFGKKAVPFEDWSSELEPHFEITKIAEASFSEVYRLSARSSTNATGQESVLKAVALKTPPDAPLPCQLQTRAIRDREGQMEKEMAEREENDQWKSEVGDVLSEVKLLQNLNQIPGFTNFRDLTILQGRPSAAFSDAWKAWNKSRPRGKKSEFPDPSKKASYDDTQLWAIVEMQDAGTDCEKIMEHGGLGSVWEVWDVFWGVCLSVAKAEETCHFEHRDLHMGNICVRSSRAGGDVTNATVKDPIRRKFRFSGLETTVIDYTLSRADILPSSDRRSSSLSLGTPTSPSSNHSVDDADVAWLDLDKDPAIFEGDASEEYQYEIYRYMRGAALYNNPLQNEPAPAENIHTPRRSPRKNTHIRFDESESPRRSPRKTIVPEPVLQPVWKRFHPKTNLVWTHFLLHKLLNHLADSGNTPDQFSPEDTVENVDSDEDPAKVKKKALKLHSVLKRVSELLCPVALGREESLGSVKELVVLALEERWLRVADVAA
jgi:serine/threonine-protein kinase haspin